MENYIYARSKDLIEGVSLYSNINYEHYILCIVFAICIIEICTEVVSCNNSVAASCQYKCQTSTDEQNHDCECVLEDTTQDKCLGKWEIVSMNCEIESLLVLYTK